MLLRTHWSTELLTNNDIDFWFFCNLDPLTPLLCWCVRVINNCRNTFARLSWGSWHTFTWFQVCHYWHLQNLTKVVRSIQDSSRSCDVFSDVFNWSGLWLSFPQRTSHLVAKPLVDRIQADKFLSFSSFDRFNRIKVLDFQKLFVRNLRPALIVNKKSADQWSFFLSWVLGLPANPLVSSGIDQTFLLLVFGSCSLQWQQRQYNWDRSLSARGLLQFISWRNQE
jgi:hypothetical protein